MVKIEFGKNYYKTLDNLLIEQPNILQEIDRVLKLFKKNPQDSRIDNHALHKSLNGKYAFSVTDDIRIVYEWTGKTTVRFLAVGTHRKLYNRN